jgi:hypothetical protein
MDNDRRRAPSGFIIDEIELMTNPDAPSIKCPRCGAVSYNPNDVEYRYCGWCHRFLDDP